MPILRTSVVAADGNRHTPLAGIGVKVTNLHFPLPGNRSHHRRQGAAGQRNNDESSEPYKPGTGQR